MSDIKTTGRIFRADMVRAIKADHKKMTRRIMNPQPAPGSVDPGMTVFDGDYGVVFFEPIQTCDGGIDFNSVFYKSPWGGPGDRVYVRETCRAVELNSGLDCVEYLADGALIPIDNTEEASLAWVDLHHYRGKRGATVPSIFMPRWASRFTLEITDVRVERLQDISRDDALAEGIDRWDDTASVSPYRNYRKGESGEMDLHCSCPERSFMTLWQSINGPESWEANPWVWVISFKVVEVRRGFAS